MPGIWSHLNKLVKNTICPPRDPKKSFAGKTIVMTGATSDTGYETALKFARLGAAKIIIGARDLHEANVLKAHIDREARGRKKDVVLIFELDLSSFPSVEDFVNNVQKSTSKVHAVILNASFHNEEVRNEDDEIIRSPHGSEMHLQVNVISTAYLAILLLALLLETSIEEKSPTHLEFAGCQRYGQQDFDFFLKPEDSILKHLNNYACPSVQFPTVKFLEMAVMNQLSESVKASKVIVFAACPGRCEKPEWRDPGSKLSVDAKLYKRMFARTCEQGSRTLVSGVLQGPQIHGKLWKNDKVQNPTQFYFDWHSGQKLGGAVWVELFEGFRRMRNRLVMDAIMPGGLLAENTTALRELYPRNFTDFPLSGENDTSFWGTTVDAVDAVDAVDEEPAEEPTADVTG